MAIDIDKEKTRFFISINKVGIHSFVTLGIYDEFQVEHVLCQVGKYIFRTKICGSYGQLATSNFIFNALFSNVKARLLDEKKHVGDYEHLSISYHASDITYEQYLEFVQLLEVLQTPKNKYACFKPEITTGNHVVLNETDELLFHNPEEEGPLEERYSRLKDSVSGLNVMNTCRHSGIILIEETQHRPVSSGISSNFFNELPCATELKKGVPVKKIPFYVLPISPAAYPELDNKKKEIIEKLYRRMEDLLATNPNSKKTQAKFLCLKNLYLQLVGPQKSLTLDELLDSILTWKDTNQATLSTLRTSYFTDCFFHRKVATMEMVKNIIQDLDRTIQNGPS